MPEKILASSERCPICGNAIPSDQRSCASCDAMSGRHSPSEKRSNRFPDQRIAEWIGILALVISGGSVFAAFSWTQSDVDPAVISFSFVMLLIEITLLWGIPFWVISELQEPSPDLLQRRSKLFWQTQLFLCLTAFPLYLLLCTACSRMLPKGPHFEH